MKKASVYEAALRRALRHSLEYLDRLDGSPVSATVTKETLRERLDRPLAEAGADPAAIIDDLAADTAGGLLGNSGGRFFAWVIGGALPSALAADWLTSTWDQNTGLYACAPAASIIEEVCGRWLKELLGLPAEASFALVTGSQMAHTTCLAAARHRLLAERGWDVERHGLAGAPRIRMLTSGTRHGTIDRALRLLGFGTDALVDLPAGPDGCMSAPELARALEAMAGEPVIVHLQAGDINTGAFDPFEEVLPVARAHGAWSHVDGAFGLWAHASPAHRHLTAGVAGADSWTTDGHKWLNVPYDSGFAFVADPEAHRASMSYRASYLTHDTEARDPLDWGPEWSRRGRGVATYAAIRELGREGVAALVAASCRHASRLVSRIGALDGAEMLCAPVINQGLVRFLDPAPGAAEADHDRRTDEVIESVVRSGEAMFGGTTWRGKRCMRVSVSGWQTDDADVDRAVEAVRRALR